MFISTKVYQSNINANALCDCFLKTGQLVNKQLTTFYQMIMVIKNNTINVVFVISVFSDFRYNSRKTVIAKSEVEVVH